MDSVRWMYIQLQMFSNDDGVNLELACTRSILLGWDETQKSCTAEGQKCARTLLYNDLHHIDSANEPAVTQLIQE